MNNQDRFLEIKVGLFVLTGLIVTAVMAFWFGKMGENAKESYPLVLELPNAKGILKNSDVQLAGARIGFVADKPRISANVSSVVVELQINMDVKIPRETTFQVGSSGLLGDTFVEVTPTAAFKPDQFNPTDASRVWQPGEKVIGREAGGLDALTKKGELVLDTLKEEIDKLKVTTDNIDRVLSRENADNLGKTLENLNKTSANFVELSKNASQVVASAQGAVDSAKETFTTANAAAGDLRTAMADAKKVMDGARDLLRKASTGDGLIAALLTDRRLADDLRALVANMRQRGVLFYRDTAPRVPAPAQAPRRR